ncbi:MAG: DUF3368 domain-containing protein [Candidatus Competibacteraceae bacterium]|nr:DUF3368 domain-containing protein [Candidatus Competibacteraceae bacterium]
MVPEPLVMDTGPLISLGRADAFGWVRQLPFHFLIPEAVANELTVGREAGYPVSVPDWIEVRSLTGRLPLNLTTPLGAGESAVISLALQEDLTTVGLDEWRGRRAALAVGLRVTGSLGLLGRAKHLGLIHQVRPWVERLGKAGAWYDPGLIQKFLAAFGEAQ